MNRATVNKIFQKHPVYVKAGMIAVISIIIFGCVYSKDNGKKLEKDEKGREILRRNESGKDELKNMKVKIDEKQEDISISVSGKKYDEEELKNAFSEAEKEVEQAVLGKNKSLDEVRSDLNLITSVPEKNMKVSWELDLSLVEDATNEKRRYFGTFGNTSISKSERSCPFLFRFVFVNMIFSIKTFKALFFSGIVSLPHSPSKFLQRGTKFLRFACSASVA